ncbi:MAG: hypothetical protein ACTSUE_24040 [Promethearchaeota archaeon]
MIVLKYTRKAVVIQMQLDDYVGAMQKHVFRMNVSKEYIAGKKALKPKQRRKKRGRKSLKRKGTQTNLIYWLGLFSMTTISPCYLKRCRAPRIRTQDEVSPHLIPAREYTILQCCLKFTGYNE